MANARSGGGFPSARTTVLVRTHVSDMRWRKTMICIMWPMAEANMTAALTCHEKEEKALRIRKLKYFL